MSNCTLCKGKRYLVVPNLDEGGPQEIPCYFCKSTGQYEPSKHYSNNCHTLTGNVIDPTGRVVYKAEHRPA